MFELTTLKKLWEKYSYKLFFFIGRLGIILIYISEIDFYADKSNTSLTSEEYRQLLEKSLTDLLSEVDGAGKVKIMVTLECGEENIYAFHEKSDTDQKNVTPGQSGQNQQRTSYENEIVLTDSGKQPIVEKVIQPAVQGVVVLCQGAENIKVTSDITNAVSVVLNIPTNRVCVIKMQ